MRAQVPPRVAGALCAAPALAAQRAALLLLLSLLARVEVRLVVVCNVRATAMLCLSVGSNAAANTRVLRCAACCAAASTGAKKGGPKRTRDGLKNGHRQQT